MKVVERGYNGGRSAAVEGIEMIKESAKVGVQRWKGLW